MNKLKQFGIALSLMMVVVSGVVGLSVANAPTAAACGKSSMFLPTWYDGLCENGNIKSPGDDMKGFLSKIAMNIVTIILTIVGYVSLGFIIWGGFKYMISGDNASGISAAKTTILNAIIGLVLSIMSVAIVKLIADSIG
ncbi:MAG: hypothetical protein WAS27_02120 [Candidatus Saccharimonadales bacterium]